MPIFCFWSKVFENKTLKPDKVKFCIFKIFFIDSNTEDNQIDARHKGKYL